MNYYYDVVLNFSDEFINFYEWDKDDAFDYFKRIPLFMVSYKQFREIVSHDIRVSNEFLESIKNKAKSNNKNISYTCIFADKNGCIALEFNSNGNVIARSALLVLDEVNINDIIYTLNSKFIDYSIINKLKINSGLRFESKMKKLIKLELNSLIKSNNLDKLKFLYSEWFDDFCDTDNFKVMLDDLDSVDDDKLLKLYNIIKLSYNNV